jgi:(p)ppGpp synthase/HD superfamily hydrolase
MKEKIIKSFIKNNIIEKAARISVLAHENQTRKGDGSPYLVHPFMVALKLAKYNFSDTVIAAALVHDVLEDTDFPENKLREEVCEEVFEIVKAVTNDDSLPWEEKKKKYVETVKNGPEGAKAVSLADKIHNLETLFIVYEDQGSNIWKRFNKGKEKQIWFGREVLKMLKETWEHPMINEYEQLLNQENKLE